MWVIYRDPKTPYVHVDKNVLCLVEDQHIHEYQQALAAAVHQSIQPFVEDVLYLQSFVGLSYYARRYVPTIPHIDTILPEEQPEFEIRKASLFRDVEPQNLYSIVR